jgi:ectoine hydroxylase-related dioxygenase (phytanoyl-CoA dioxygenase family)
MGRVLTGPQLAHYDEDGVLFPLPALEPEALAEFRSGFDAVTAHRGDNLRPQNFGQWHLCFGWAYELATHPAILDAVEDVLGPDILVHSTSAFAKRPRSPEYVSWHQDGYYWGLDAPRLVSAWIALSDSTSSNGCLRVIPGSHRRARLEHATRQDQHNMLGTGLFVTDSVDELSAVDVQLAAGEMSFHHVDIVHGSGPNGSDGPRIGFAVRYTTPEVSQERSHHEVVLARGTDRYGHFALLSEHPGRSIAEGWLAQESRARERRSPQLPSSRRATK